MFQETLAAAVETREGIAAPLGFRAAGVHCGVKKTKKDLALIVSDVPATAAAVFTLNKVQAAPVVLSKEHFAAGRRFRAIVVNSGNANACTGERGYQDAKLMAETTAQVLGVQPAEVFVASTGVIGEPLPIEKVVHGIKSVAGNLETPDPQTAVEAIMTTDTFPKIASRSFRLDGLTVTIGGMAKGSGMIHPNMATMLGFVTTDATFEPAVFQTLLKKTVDKTFNRIVVDGDTSTNDMVIALANGESGVSSILPDTENYTIFKRELHALLKKLALDIVKDGEGATKLVEIRVCGARHDADALRAAKSVALSPLVKTAIHGEDANWGRIIAAVGYSGIEFDPAAMRIVINDTEILGENYRVSLSNAEANMSLRGDSIALTIHLREGEGTATCWTCDLSEEYVVINGSYRS